MSADEMFEELGYRKPKCRGVIEIWEKENGKHSAVRMIIFETDNSVRISEYFKYNDNYYEESTDITVITIQELQAIYKKCEELGWIKEGEKQ